MTNPLPNPTQASLLSDAWYNKLKLTAQLLLPALAALYLTLAQLLDLPAAEQVAGVIAAVNVFAGVAIAWLKSLHTASGAGVDGTLTIEEGEDTSTLRLTSVDAKALDTKDTIVFKVNRSPAA